MSLITTAKKTLSQEMQVPMAFLKALTSKYPDLPSAEDIAVDEDFADFLDPAKSGRKRLTPEERRGIIDESKCGARIWKNAGKGMGYDNVQCGCKKIGDHFCKKHQKAEDEGGWWLGKITEPRPENPIGPPGSKNPREHIWNTDTEGNEIVKQKKERKSSPNKSKKKSDKSGAELGLEELKALLAAAEKEEEVEKERARNRLAANSSGGEKPDDQNEDEDEKIVFEGIEYHLNREDNIVTDPEDAELMGTWNKEEEKIEFEDDDAESKHNKRK
jgi:hypothetical protein